MVKVVVAVIPPFELVWIRYIIAILALLIIGFIKRQSWKIHKRDLGIIGRAERLEPSRVIHQLSLQHLKPYH